MLFAWRVAIVLHERLMVLLKFNQCAARCAGISTNWPTVISCIQFLASTAGDCSGVFVEQRGVLQAKTQKPVIELWRRHWRLTLPASHQGQQQHENCGLHFFASTGVFAENSIVSKSRSYLAGSSLAAA
jgi:hypothetical protein